jgi:hypothetical protein
MTYEFITFNDTFVIIGSTRAVIIANPPLFDGVDELKENE